MEPDYGISAQVRRIFDRLAGHYDDHAVLEQEVASRQLERLEFIQFTPHRIVDLGCGTGQASADLKKQFPEAEVIGLDSSQCMLSQLQRRPGVRDRLSAVCADMSAIPLADHSVDLLFSNLAMQWSLDPVSVFVEIRRVLKPGGMLLFSSFGPGTLKELKAALGEADGTEDTEDFADILELGDALMAAGFKQPVMDAERITVNYSEIDSLVRELEATGTLSLVKGGGSLAAARDHLVRAYEPFMVDSRYPVSYEIVYGTAFGPDEGQPLKTPQGDVVTFSVESLRKSGQRKD
jgi:malonyl-CoA O-methyltransferase